MMSPIRTTCALTLWALTCSACLYDFDQYRPPSSNLDYTKSWDMQAAAPVDMPRDTPTPPADLSPDVSPDVGPDLSQDMPQDMPRDVPQDMPADVPQDISEDMPIDPMLCGNGAIDPGESCDGSSCPDTCDDLNACTVDVEMGSRQTCDLVCDNSQEISSCGPADGCCPARCTEAQDADCAVNCNMPNTWPMDWKDLENEILPIINQRRQAGVMCGTMAKPPVPPLTLSLKLIDASRCHAHDMATNNWIGPVSPPPNNTTVADRVNARGYAWDKLAVNVADTDTAQATVDGWFNSTSLCGFLMRADFDEVGVGYAFDADANGGGQRWSLILSKAL